MTAVLFGVVVFCITYVMIQMVGKTQDRLIARRVYENKQDLHVSESIFQRAIRMCCKLHDWRYRRPVLGNANLYRICDICGRSEWSPYRDSPWQYNGYGRRMCEIQRELRIARLNLEHAFSEGRSLLLCTQPVDPNTPELRAITKAEDLEHALEQELSFWSLEDRRR